MNISKVFVIIAAFSVSACAYCQPRERSAKTNVTLAQYKRVAVIKFANPRNDASGQEAADILALGFAKKGFNVAGSNQITGLIDQNDLNSSGLTPDTKSRLKSAGIDSIVSGAVNEYACSRDTGPLFVKADLRDSHCSVAVTAKMLDLDSGEIVWGATGSNAEEGRWVTADSVLRSVIKNMQEKIPDITRLKAPSPVAGKRPAQPRH